MSRESYQNFTEEEKEKGYQYYLGRKKRLPDYRRHYNLGHKKQLNGILKILGMNPTLNFSNFRGIYA